MARPQMPDTNPLCLRFNEMHLSDAAIVDRRWAMRTAQEADTNKTRLIVWLLKTRASWRRRLR